MNCWICGNIADSKEHIIKASDIRAFFGKVSEDRPLYKHTEGKKNQKIKSAKSINLKTKKNVICQSCNNKDTAKHDVAWSLLLRFMHDNWGHIKKNGKVKLGKVFPGKSKKEAKNLHLFFVKNLACRIVDENIPIPIELFSYAVENNVAHPSLYLSFNARTIGPKETLYVGPSNVHGKEKDGKPISVTYYYTIGELDVQVTWFENRPAKNVRNAWHPNGKSNVIKFRRG
ncbi:hypothetical protein ACJJIE_04625 [Microbulbifer sp. TRSA001]|uniref:hypothetical protein n=1 Tax=Microbulbifer sp. TRSA001 TaxID=3243381 RepID=UPI00403A27D7